jgi:hypothetical protein
VYVFFVSTENCIYVTVYYSSHRIRKGLSSKIKEELLVLRQASNRESTQTRSQGTGGLLKDCLTGNK